MFYIAVAFIIIGTMVMCHGMHCFAVASSLFEWSGRELTEMERQQKLVREKSLNRYGWALFLLGNLITFVACTCVYVMARH